MEVRWLSCLGCDNECPMEKALVFIVHSFVLAKDKLDAAQRKTAWDHPVLVDGNFPIVARTMRVRPGWFVQLFRVEVADPHCFRSSSPLALFHGSG